MGAFSLQTSVSSILIPRSLCSPIKLNLIATHIKMIETSAFTEPSTVSTTLNYFVPPVDGSRPFQRIFGFNVVVGEPMRNWTQASHAVEIENLRGKESSVSLDANGFQFLSGVQPKHTKFTDNEEIKKEYYPESEELLKKVTGASRVVFFDHSKQ